MTTEELIAKAERVEHRPNGDYYILKAGDLTGEEFAELIMEEVKRLQLGKVKYG